jgi:hypothetical protein
MKGLKCNDQTRTVSTVLLCLYIIYGIFNIPLATFILSLAICVIVYSTSKSLEYGVLALLTTSVVVPFLHRRTEGFVDASAPTGIKVTGKAPTAPNASPAPTAPTAPTAPPAPTAPFASPAPTAPTAVTGVAGTSTQNAETLNATSQAPTFVGNSTPATANPPPATVQKISETGVPPANMPADLAKDGFEDKGEGGLFKLGKIPTDEKGGFHIDTGTSVLNALKSLKPDQISAMTQDTKQLIETQKTLMNMLQSFKPMMSEGKEMMDTFQQMFSSKGGSAMGALQTANDTLTSQ